MPLPGLCRVDQKEVTEGSQDAGLVAHLALGCGIVRRLWITAL